MPNIINKKQIDYLKKFRKDEDPLIIELEEYAKKNKVPILNWLASDFMEQLIKIRSPKRVLELGTAIAYSSIKIARSLTDGAVLNSIELSRESVKIARQNIKNAGLSDKVTVIQGNAKGVLPKIDFKYDFIFLDADKEDYLELFEMSIPLLKKGGIIFVDNLLWHGYAAAERVAKSYKKSTEHIRRFNEIFMNTVNLDSTIIPVGDGIGIGIKK